MNAATAAEKLLESGAGRWLLDLGPWGGRHSKENGMKNSKKREWTAGVQKSTEYNTAYAIFFLFVYFANYAYQKGIPYNFKNSLLHNKGRTMDLFW